MTRPSIAIFFAVLLVGFVLCLLPLAVAVGVGAVMRTGEPR